jgi:hypothetical protein
MHEGVASEQGCKGGFSRNWFEWANALFVVLVESALGDRCDVDGRMGAVTSMVETVIANGPALKQLKFYENRYHNNLTVQNYYQGIEAQVKQ